MEGRPPVTFASNFRQFFVRGLAILLPTVLTIWLLIAAYGFVQARIAAPINQGVKELVVRTTPWPAVAPDAVDELRRDIERTGGERYQAYRESGFSSDWLERDARRLRLERWWASYSIVMDLIGLVLAIVLIYMVGVVLGSYIGHRLYRRGERLLNRVPLIRRVYPSVKQVTDFFVGDKSDKLRFSRVVAVEYPRKRMWSIGLVTGDTMQAIQDAAGEECLTIFIPSSPTPFTGYVVTAPRSDTIELPITVEDAVKFTVSGGVLIPPNQQIPDSPEGPADPARAGRVGRGVSSFFVRCGAKSMQVIVTGRHLEITDAIRQHAIDKGDRMPRYYDRVSEVEVVISKSEPNHYHVEMIASVDRHDPFVASVKHEDLYAAIDEASHKLERQLTDHKEKLRNRKHSAAQG